MGRQTLVESSYYNIPTNQDGDAEYWAGAHLPPSIQEWNWYTYKRKQNLQQNPPGVKQKLDTGT